MVLQKSMLPLVCSHLGFYSSTAIFDDIHTISLNKCCVYFCSQPWHVSLCMLNLIHLSKEEVLKLQVSDLLVTNYTLYKCTKILQPWISLLGSFMFKVCTLLLETE